MVKILYDLDISKVNNCRYFDNTGHISSLTKEITSKLLKTYDSIFAYQYLGGGYDSVCFVNSNDHKFYIVEPANGLIIAYDLIEGLIQFETKLLSTKTNFEFSFGSLMDETFFRPHRNDDEFLVIGKVINFPDIDKNKVILKYAGSLYEWNCFYVDFVPELLRFGERMIHLYDRVLPDFKEYALYPKLKEKLLEDNILRQNYGHLMGFDNLGKSFMDYIE